MTHLSPEVVWEAARASAAAEDQAHLQGCAECRGRLAEARAAQVLLASLPPPPAMPVDLARRVGIALVDQADRRAASRWTSWLSFFSPRVAVASALAVGVAVVVLAVVRGWRTDSVSDQPVAAERADSAPTPKRAAPALTGQPVERGEPAQPRAAVVASARRARGAGGSLKAAQALEVGSTVDTDVGGRAWIRLPDGSRAGVAAESQIQLTQLEEKAITVAVGRGSVALVVPHREDRLLRVIAGELVVTDLGTRFVVSRETARVIVAVDEGSVDLMAGGRHETLRAGHIAQWREGQLTIAPAPVIPSQAPDQPAPDAPSGPDVAADDAPPSTGEAVAPVAPDAWEEPARHPSGEAPTVEDAWALPPEQVAESAPAPGGPTPVADPLDLSGLERRMAELRRQIRVPFPLSGKAYLEVAAKDVRRLADAGDCVGAVLAADRWLREADPTAELVLRRSVLLQKRRCLARLGRMDEAQAVGRELEMLGL